MNRRTVDRLVQATLYEGYILYPYRPTSVKNQVRWTFGGVHPRAYSEGTGGSEPWWLQTQCLLRSRDDCPVTVTVRFLRPLARTAAAPLRGGTTPQAGEDCGVAGFAAVASLRVGDITVHSWEEAVEDSLALGPLSIRRLIDDPQRIPIARLAHREIEELKASDGSIAGALIRDQETVDGEVLVRALRVSEDVTRVSVVIRNLTAFDSFGVGARERAMRQSLVSTHAILEAGDGRWISLTDPPEELAVAASECHNVGLWPVLVATSADEDDTVLASPIILEDHPRLAPESAGDLFDSTEIDEILSLRILALTDEEKSEVRAADEHARALLDRTESLSDAALMRLHGTIRELRPVRGDGR